MRRTRAEVEKVLYLDTDDDFMAIWDEQEATIRELADALAEVVEDSYCCTDDGVCGLDSEHARRAREVLKRARGAS